MDPRQLVGLRKALGAAPDAGEGAGSPDDAGAPPMMVQCPDCGSQFDANSPEAQIQDAGPEVSQA